MFGRGCRQRCQCENNALCDHVSGACTCQQGWTGTYCEKRKTITHIGNQNTCLFSSHRLDKYILNMFVPVSACPWGFYGLDCQEKCLCLNGGSCNHISGECSCPAGWIGPFCNLSELQLHQTQSFQTMSHRCPRSATTQITHQTLLISRVHAEVMILLSLSWQRAPLAPMGKDVTRPVAAVTLASATRPVDSVHAHQAGPDPAAQKVGENTKSGAQQLFKQVTDG